MSRLLKKCFFLSVGLHVLLVSEDGECDSSLPAVRLAPGSGPRHLAWHPGAW